MIMTEQKFFGETAKFHHIGIAVKSIKDTGTASHITTDPVQKVSISCVSLYKTTIELIEPCGDDSPISESLKKGIKLLHICYEVPDIEAAIKKCREHGFHCIARPVPAVAFNNRKIAWVYSNAYGLFELLENPDMGNE